MADRRGVRLALIDQALSSLTNFVAGLFAAHSLSPSDFGTFALISVGYVLALGATRSLFSEVAMVVHRKDPDGGRAYLGAVDLVAACAVLAGMALAVAGAVVCDAALLAIVAAGLGLAVMLIQDALRMVAIGTGHTGQAVASDAVWLGVLVVAIVFASGLGDPTAWSMFATWGLAAAPGLIVGAFLANWRPALRRGSAFAGQHKALARAFFADWVLKSGGGQLATYGVGIAGGLTAVGGIRAGLLVLGPLNVVFSGLQLAAVPAAVKKRKTSPMGMRRALGRMSLVLGGAALVAGFVLAFAPEDLLAALVGEQASGLSNYVLPLSVYLASTGFSAGSHVGLRVLQVGPTLVKTRIISTVLYLVPGLIMLLMTGSPVWALWGLAAGGLLGVLVWERAFSHALR